jgi:hypothetical protein
MQINLKDIYRSYLMVIFKEATVKKRIFTISALLACGVALLFHQKLTLIPLQEPKKT